MPRARNPLLHAALDLSFRPHPSTARRTSPVESQGKSCF
jgi:hypothetical protein